MRRQSDAHKHAPNSRLRNLRWQRYRENCIDKDQDDYNDKGQSDYMLIAINTQSDIPIDLYEMEFCRTRTHKQRSAVEFSQASSVESGEIVVLVSRASWATQTAGGCGLPACSNETA